MPAPLPAAIRLVQSRIQAERDYLAGHETRTRQFLIDPILTALGWDILDPAVVVLEAQIRGGFADYLGASETAPAIVVEAKRLGTNLRREPTEQVVRYSNWLGLEHAVLTDGNIWHHIEVSGIGATHSRLLNEVECEGTPEPEVATALSVLSRSAMIHSD